MKYFVKKKCEKCDDPLTQSHISNEIFCEKCENSDDPLIYSYMSNSFFHHIIVYVNSGVERNHFYAHLGKILKTMPRIDSKTGATLKGKNLLPEGANSFL